jgi:hypothetical protein
MYDKVRNILYFYPHKILEASGFKSRSEKLVILMGLETQAEMFTPKAWALTYRVPAYQCPQSGRKRPALFFLQLLLPK